MSAAVFAPVWAPRHLTQSFNTDSSFVLPSRSCQKVRLSGSVSGACVLLSRIWELVAQGCALIFVPDLSGISPVVYFLIEHRLANSNDRGERRSVFWAMCVHRLRCTAAPIANSSVWRQARSVAFWAGRVCPRNQASFLPSSLGVLMCACDVYWHPFKEPIIRNSDRSPPDPMSIFELIIRLGLESCQDRRNLGWN